VKTWRELDNWVLEGGNICTNSLSLVMMRNQQMDTNTYNDKNIIKENIINNNNNNNVNNNNINNNFNLKEDYTSNIQRKEKERDDRVRQRGSERGSEISEKYSTKYDYKKSLKSDNSMMNDKKEKRDKGQAVFQDENEEEEIEGNINEQNRKFQYYAELFQISQNVFEILCFSVDEFSKINPSVSTKKSARTGVSTGNLMRTFSLDADLKDVFENCFLVGRKDVFMLTTGQ
jgi:hypothetical protein